MATNIRKGVALVDVVAAWLVVGDLQRCRNFATLRQRWSDQGEV